MVLDVYCVDRVWKSRFDNLVSRDFIERLLAIGRISSTKFIKVRASVLVSSISEWTFIDFVVKFSNMCLNWPKVMDVLGLSWKKLSKLLSPSSSLSTTRVEELERERVLIFFVVFVFSCFWGVGVGLVGEGGDVEEDVSDISRL